MRGFDARLRGGFGVVLRPVGVVSVRSASAVHAARSGRGKTLMAIGNPLGLRRLRWSRKAAGS